MYFFFESLHHIIEVYGASVTSQEKSSNLINIYGVSVIKILKYDTKENKSKIENITDLLNFRRICRLKSVEFYVAIRWHATRIIIHVALKGWHVKYVVAKHAVVMTARQRDAARRVFQRAPT